MSAPGELTTLVEQGGKYKIEKELFEGANAYAFVATHIHLKTTVFLKVYNIDPADPGIFNEPRLLVDATRDPGCPNLVEVRDAERLGTDYALIAMEYIDGGSVLRRIEQAPLAQSDAVKATIGILMGVAHLHWRDIVHRDIKPSNIVLANGLTHTLPNITDFGSATKLLEPNATVRASRHSSLYVPPEGWQEPRQYSKISDLYQVGIVLHEMLNGPLPYDPAAYIDKMAVQEVLQSGSKDFQSLLDSWLRTKISNEAIARAATAGTLLRHGPTVPYVSTRLKKIVRRATASDPSKRFQSASDFIGTLQQHDFPNWVCGPPPFAFSAVAWRSWDWHVESGTDSVAISRSRSGTAQFRRWKAAEDLTAAARIVEDFR